MRTTGRGSDRAGRGGDTDPGRGPGSAVTSEPSPAGRTGGPLRTDPSFLLEVFVAANLLFLVLDVWLAHASNDFEHPAEWIPLGFAALGGLAVVAGLAVGLRRDTGRGWRRGFGRWLGLAVGWGAVAVGVSGLMLHLESQFFRQLTLRSLVYSAPFVAPLSFAGLGLLLLLDRMVDPDGRRWTAWVLFLALGGFVGNFVLSLADHAQNGFFYATEWIPVVASAAAVGYLAALFVREPREGFLRLGFWVLGLQAAVGAVGFVLHASRLLEPASAGLAERVVHGAPLFAPLLFVDLAALAVLGLWDLHRKTVRAAEEAGPADAPGRDGGDSAPGGASAFPDRPAPGSV